MEMNESTSQRPMNPYITNQTERRQMPYPQNPTQAPQPPQTVPARQTEASPQKSEAPATQGAPNAPAAQSTLSSQAVQNVQVSPPIAYHAATPYPPIHVAEQNPRYAAAMLDNMGGQNSEMSAVSLYFYNHLITAEYRELAETFHQISMVEMHHLEIFATLAMRLGENPRLWSRRNRGGYAYWTPACLSYPPIPCAPIPCAAAPCVTPLPSPCAPAVRPENSSLRTLLSMAIEAEQEALKKYTRQTTWIQDICICDNLRRIAADEQMHIDILTRLYHRY